MANEAFSCVPKSLLILNQASFKDSKKYLDLCKDKALKHKEQNKFDKKDINSQFQSYFHPCRDPYPEELSDMALRAKAGFSNCHQFNVVHPTIDLTDLHPEEGCYHLITTDVWKTYFKKDVVRTDRSNPYYKGDKNPNLQVMKDILMNYAFYCPTIGYSQGMSDLLATVLAVIQNESDTSGVLLD
ncbi:unnamed protein product [Didymodactylos carnosus]|uniref:Rab-GAP TBC domain-containing protein n=1 Tax=Didymodactylos carnosus TaxID=1234261 RepID=A0A815ALF1_9BILA|nr:unnamed protein product [Didymodactylos carnosus]CAF4031670.1 unnamed protein product [Didymodactylos carnosus]